VGEIMTQVEVQGYDNVVFVQGCPTSHREVIGEYVAIVE
jgi:hypothetical protein